MNPLIQSILERHDGGEVDARAIADTLGVSFGYVYGVLREHRPKRPRKARERTSEKRKLILGLLANGIAARRAAFLAGCSPAYVYALIKQEAAA